jgi:hypothetical protein
METKQPTLQDILTYFHADYSDLELAEIVDLSQPTINNIRNGKQSGIRKLDHFVPLIEEYEKLTGMHFDMPNGTSHIHKEQKPRKTKPANKTTEEIIEDNETTEEIIEDSETSGFNVLPLLIGILFVAGMVGYAVIQTRAKKSKSTPNQQQNETTNETTNQQSEGDTPHE